MYIYYILILSKISGKEIMFDVIYGIQMTVAECINNTSSMSFIYQFLHCDLLPFFYFHISLFLFIICYKRELKSSRTELLPQIWPNNQSSLRVFFFFFFFIIFALFSWLGWILLSTPRKIHSAFFHYFFLLVNQPYLSFFRLIIFCL